MSLRAIGTQHFLQCDCCLYERCGIPCSHILKVSDDVTKDMIAIQHWKIYPVYHGVKDSDLSHSLMKKVTWQNCHENYGTPILESTLNKCHRIFELLSIQKSDAVYPLFYDDISEMEFKKVIFVLRSKNVTTTRELERAFSLSALSSSVE